MEECKSTYKKFNKEEYVALLEREGLTEKEVHDVIWNLIDKGVFK